MMCPLSEWMIAEDPYTKIYDFSNLHAAYWKACRGKRSHTFVIQYEVSLIEKLYNLMERLEQRRYKPRKPFFFYVYEPKKRLVCANNFLYAITFFILHYFRLPNIRYGSVFL